MFSPKLAISLTLYIKLNPKSTGKQINVQRDSKFSALMRVIVTFHQMSWRITGLIINNPPAADHRGLDRGEKMFYLLRHDGQEVRPEDPDHACPYIPV